VFDPLDLVQAPARQGATLRETAHRPWPLPRERWLMGQTWDALLFAHWRVPIAALRAHLPDELEVDTHEGEAWLGITPFVVTGLRLRGLPALPFVSSFLELNVRTYVTDGGEKPGIWFFSLDASSRAAVAAARRLYKLPYFHARMQGPPSFRCARVGDARPHVFEAWYRPEGRRFLAEPGSLEHFLTERYCLYTTDGAGVLHRAEIQHPPWPLQPAEVRVELNTIPPDGLEVGAQPEHVLYARRQDVVIWPLAPV
jgi:uncharacterized protein YqjF (DUF2071 family)